MLDNAGELHFEKYRNDDGTTTLGNVHTSSTGNVIRKGIK